MKHEVTFIMVWYTKVRCVLFPVNDDKYAQLTWSKFVQGSIPEVRGSTPVIGKILLNICLLSTVLKRRKKIKRGREWPTFLKKIYIIAEAMRIRHFLTFRLGDRPLRY